MHRVTAYVTPDLDFSLRCRRPSTRTMTQSRKNHWCGRRAAKSSRSHRNASALCSDFAAQNLTASDLRSFPSSADTPRKSVGRGTRPTEGAKKGTKREIAKGTRTRNAAGRGTRRRLNSMTRFRPPQPRHHTRHQTRRFLGQITRPTTRRLRKRDVPFLPMSWD